MGRRRVTASWLTKVWGVNLVSPAASLQPYAQVQVFCQMVAPGTLVEGFEGGQAGELAVAAQAGGPEPGAASLEDLGVDDEFHVLHAGQQGGVPVVPADPDLDRPHPGVGEQRRHGGQGIGLDAAVGVQDNQDHPVTAAAAAGQPMLYVPVGGIQRGALARAGVGCGATQQPHPVAGVVGGDLGGGVVGAVVDDERRPVVIREGEQATQAGVQYQLLVQARQDEHEEQFLRGRPGRRHSAPADQEALPGVAGSGCQGRGASSAQHGADVEEEAGDDQCGDPQSLPPSAGERGLRSGLAGRRGPSDHQARRTDSAALPRGV